MMDFDFKGFAGWHARIDEPPNAVVTGRVNLRQSVATFRHHFDLERFDAGWSFLRPRLSGKWKTFADDTMWRGLTDFRKLAQRPQGVLIQLEDWGQARDGEVSWFGLWTPLQLSSLSSITIAGAGFLTSIGHRVMQATYAQELQFDVIEMSGARSAQPHISVHYFTSAHRGSTVFWGTSEGRECLVRIERWMAQNLPDLGFWSGNEPVRHSFEHRLPGRMTAPKLAGLNCHREARSCAFFYSSKAVPQDETLKTVFQLTADHILDAREGEDVFQFVMRGAVRDPAYGGNYDIYVYSLDQAERLRDILFTNGFADVAVIGIPQAGIMDLERKDGRRTPPMSASDQAVRLAKKRENNARRNRECRARKKAARCEAMPLS